MKYYQGPLARLFALLLFISLAGPAGWLYSAHAEKQNLDARMVEARAALMQCGEQALQSQELPSYNPCYKEDAAIDAISKAIRSNALARNDAAMLLKVVPASLVMLYYVVMWIANGWTMRRPIVGTELKRQA